MGNQGRSVDNLLDDIELWSDRVARFVSGITLEEFGQDEMRQFAVAKCVEAIGEAARNLMRLHPEFVAAHPDLPLAEAYRTRNRLSHGYDTIDYAVLWRTATAHLPLLRKAAHELRETPGS